MRNQTPPFKHIVIALTALMLLLIVGSWNLPLEESICPNHNKSKITTSQECDKNSRLTLGFLIENFVADTWGNIQKKESLDGLLVLFTGMLATFTWFLFNATRGLLKNAPRVERAYISGGGSPMFHPSVQYMSFGPLPPKPAPRLPTGEFQLQVNNHGKTPGELLEYGIGFCEANAIPTQPAYTLTHFHDWLGPGTQSRPLVNVAIPHGLQHPCIYGRLYYRDIFRQKHSSGFILEITDIGSEPILAPRPYTEERDESNDEPASA